MIHISVLLKILLIQAVTPLQHFINRHFHDRDVVLIGSNLSTFLLLNQPKIIIASNGDDIPNLEQFGDFIISEGNSSSLASTVERLKYKINTRGRFLVVLQNDGTEDDHRDVFETLWAGYIYNAVLYANSRFVTWFPYQQCGKVSLVTVTKSLDPYDNKIPRNLNGCRVSVAWDELPLSVKIPFDKRDPGYSVRAVDAIFEEMGAFVEYTEDRIEYNGPKLAGRNKLLELMVTKSIDLAFNVMEIPNPTPKIEISVAYKQVICYFILPPRRKMISSTNNLVIFSSEVWSLIFISVLFMTLLWQNLTKKPLQSCFFEIIRVLLQSAMGRIPPNPATRAVFTIFFFFATNLNAIYTSQLSGILSQPSYEPKITSLAQLALSTKKLKYPDVFDHYFIGKDVYENLLGLKTQSTTNWSFDEELNDFLQTLDHGIITTNHRILYVKNYEKLHSINQEQLTTMSAFLLARRGFPLLDRLNIGLLRVIQSGIFTRWVYESQVTINKTMIPEYEALEAVLDLQRVFSTFVLLGVGFLIAILTFFVEIVYAKIVKR